MQLRHMGNKCETPSLTSAIDGGVWLASLSDRLSSWKEAAFGGQVGHRASVKAVGRRNKLALQGIGPQSSNP
jgi:hypothetical protein